MATPRKNWFKVADSVAFESWSNDVAATFMRLGAYMNTRWARDGKASSERGRVVLSLQVLQQLTGCRSLVRARRILDELATHVTLTVDRRGTDTLVDWPKYAKFQESESEVRARVSVDDRRAKPSPSPISKTSPNQEEKRETEAPPAPAADAAPRSPRRVLVDKPENFPEESKVRLRAWADRKGFDRSLLNAGLDAFRDWTPLKPPYRRTIEQWEGAFKKIVRDGVVDGKLGKPESKPKPVYRRDESGQVLVPNEWRGAS